MCGGSCSEVAIDSVNCTSKSLHHVNEGIHWVKELVPHNQSEGVGIALTLHTNVYHLKEGKEGGGGKRSKRGREGERGEKERIGGIK